jgi:hypothetical protein
VKDEQPFTATPTPRVGKLDSLGGVRQELVRIYRAGRRGELDTQHMTRFAFVLQAIAKVIEQSDLEARMAAIEKALDEPDEIPSNSTLTH